MEGGEILEPLRDRIVGRVSQEEIYDPMTGELLIGLGQEITEDLANSIQAAGIERSSEVSQLGPPATSSVGRFFREQ